MSHLLERFSFEEISIIQMCEQKKKQQLLDELNMMLLYSEEEMKKNIQYLIKKVKDLPEEEIKSIKNFPL